MQFLNITNVIFVACLLNCSKKPFSFLGNICHKRITCKDWLTWLLQQRKTTRFIKHMVFTKKQWNVTSILHFSVSKDRQVLSRYFKGKWQKIFEKLRGMGEILWKTMSWRKKTKEISFWYFKLENIIQCFCQDSPGHYAESCWEVVHHPYNT